MERHELASWLRLTLTSGVGNIVGRKLLTAFGLPAQIFNQSFQALEQVVPPQLARHLLAEPEGLEPLVEQTWQWLHEDAPQTPLRRIVTLGDSLYPPGLLNIDEPPLLLYLLGAGKFIEKQPETLANIESTASEYIANCFLNSIAVVGSRNPTPQGAATAQAMAKALAQAGLTVVSGLALGIDGAAHEGALDSLADDADALVTVAVVGTGLDRVYPKAHRELAHRIAENGLIVSEYPLGTPPLSANFPKRNRLIAGLAQGTLVVEAAPKSGSLITARLTADQGKEVFAIPGSIHSPQARGCHLLIKQGAKLVESAQDILDELKVNLPARRDEVGHAQYDLLADTPLLQAIGFDPVTLDTLQIRTGLAVAVLQTQLMELELDQQISRLPGGLFQRIKSA